jgi:hypothetical protein
MFKKIEMDLPEAHVDPHTYSMLSSLPLGAFAKLRKATIFFVMRVCPSVCMEQLGFRWKDFHEIWYFGIFRKSIE